MSAPLAFVVGISPSGIAGIGTPGKAQMHLDYGTWASYSPRLRDIDTARALCRWINARAAARANKPRRCHACGQALP